MQILTTDASPEFLPVRMNSAYPDVKDLTTDELVDEQLALSVGLAAFLFHNSPVLVNNLPTASVTTQRNPVTGDHGVVFQLQNAFAEMSTKDVVLAQPALIVVPSGPFSYRGDSALTPYTGDSPVVGEDENFVYILDHLGLGVQNLSLELWCETPAQRTAGIQWIKKQLNPDPSTYGLTLRLPFLHNLHARYSLQSYARVDSEMEAQRGYRKAIFAIEAEIPITRCYATKRAQIRLSGIVG